MKVSVLGLSHCILYSCWLAIGRAQDVAVGDTVCAEGFVMDNLCIDLGTLLDRSDIETLVGPEHHSFHCLLDVSSCRDSGYNILKGPSNGLYSVAYQIDSAGTETLIQLGRDVGICGTCKAGGTLRVGMRAEVTGTVTDVGKNGAAPTIKLTSAKVSNGMSNFCANVKAPTSAPVASPVKAPTKAPTNAPVSAPVKVPTMAPMKAHVQTPVSAPAKAPTKAPTKAPVPSAPVKAPTKAPTLRPVLVPVKAPTKAPTKAPVPAPVSPPVSAGTPPKATPVAVPAPQSPILVGGGMPPIVPAPVKAPSIAAAPTTVSSPMATAAPTAKGGNSGLFVSILKRFFRFLGRLTPR